MAVGSGEFRLYSRIEPPLKAGSYRFTTEQKLTATGQPDGALAVDPLETHVRVRSPQYSLPPDQVLSTFPPAGRDGSYGSRLPQIVIRRRTLPWERRVDPKDATKDALPWLALVLIAEGEAELKPNLPVAETVTPGIVLDTPADVEKANSLWIRKSAVDRIFPTQEEVGLLAHAREVDLADTELMMGDDDGFLAVVICNRLPLPGRDANGDEVPVKYLACLVNLCEQLDQLLPEAPAPSPFTLHPFVEMETFVSLAQQDKTVMGMSQQLSVLPKASAGTTIGKVNLDVAGAAPHEGAPGWATATPKRGTVDVYAEMAQDFVAVQGVGALGQLLDPTLRFPVLIHWSFTSTGDETFRSLMEGLDSGLLGTVGREAGEDETTAGRLPLEVVETGHVGLPHRLRRGDQVRSWYRGPLLPHPPAVDADRLPLAHSADQVRVVVPDGREDVSLAAAFEIGRMLGLSRPSMIAALLRWRQGGYQTARRTGIVEGGILAGVGILSDRVDRFLGAAAGAMVAQALVEAPEKVLGNPNPLVTAGRPVMDEGRVNSVLEAGFGLPRNVLDGDRLDVLGGLGGVEPRLPRREVFDAAAVKASLEPVLDTRFSRAALQAVAPELTEDLLGTGLVDQVPLDLRHLLSGVRGLLDAGGAFGPGLQDPGPLLPHGAVGDALDRLVETRAARRRAARDTDEEVE